ncbi:topoisomerase DNA-binding C4 zinc finger domain-containing protein [Billgrantia gudaonensis]|uniref:topoisomerase DNA-binding C4 zinc finger domain-containing protein n=1 Tax=Billgrantia gudaonensis TaxID=376427 RepID=UPI0015A3F5FD|nr:topoisomerase DNA-binding C4 zinc finger domain-containing protein [Halomonas gudaonensis]
MKALEALLDVPAETILSLVVFSGSAVFKTRMPGNVTAGGGYVCYIESFREPVLNDFQVQEAMERIETGRLAPNRETHCQHVEQLKARFEPSAKRTCPECESDMVLHTVKRGANAGNRFWGCSAYPKCRQVEVDGCYINAKKLPS